MHEGHCAAAAQPLNPLRSCQMTELERNLSKVLEEHRHESGLHIIGGQQRLIDRLVQFFEDGLKLKSDKNSRDLDN
jgi:hypothetical protein